MGGGFLTTTSIKIEIRKHRVIYSDLKNAHSYPNRMTYTSQKKKKGEHVEICEAPTAAGSLRPQLLSLVHPLPQTPIQSVFSQTRGSVSASSQSCDDSRGRLLLKLRKKTKKRGQEATANLAAAKEISFYQNWAAFLHFKKKKKK